MDLSAINGDVLVVIGIFVLLIGDRVLAFLKNRGTDLTETTKQVNDLYEWHNKEDSDGVKLWYMRDRHINRQLNELLANAEVTTEMVRQLKVNQNEILERVRRFN